MATVLCFSSQVARGAIGATAARIALEGLGHAVWCLPTVVLSNHPGHARWAGLTLPPADLRLMLDALVENAWLAEIDAVLTGYLPSVAHADLACEIIERLRAVRPDALVMCDPTFADAPKGLYIDARAARAIAQRVLPRADIVRLNAFELAWLTNRALRDTNDAVTAARSLPPQHILVTSVAAAQTRLANVLLWRERAWCACVTARPSVPHGTGDLLNGLFLGHLLRQDIAPDRALARALGALESVLDASSGHDELQLAGRSRDRWLHAQCYDVQEMEKDL